MQALDTDLDALEQVLGCESKAEVDECASQSFKFFCWLQILALVDELVEKSSSMLFEAVISKGLKKRYLK
jgi:hypothetical protein